MIPVCFVLVLVLQFSGADTIWNEVPRSIHGSCSAALKANKWADPRKACLLGLVVRIAPDCLLQHVVVLDDDMRARVSQQGGLGDSGIDRFLPCLERTGGIASVAINPSVIALGDDEMALRCIRHVTAPPDTKRRNGSAVARPARS